MSDTNASICEMVAVIDILIMFLSFDQFPVEILLIVFRYLDVSDILRMRRVSRYLNRISYSKEVWFHAYRNAHVVRPPGPFLSHSAQYLENTLVACARTDHRLRNSTSNPGQGFKLGEIQYTSAEISVNLVFGRFLLIAFSHQIRCYDLNVDLLDSSSEGSVVYVPAGIIISFRHVSAVDMDGHPFACTVLTEKRLDQTLLSIHLFNAGEQSKATLDLLHKSEYEEFYFHSANLGPRAILILGRGRRPVWHIIALDVHSRTRFLLQNTNEIQETGDSRNEYTCISTSTYILVVKSALRFSDRHFQAFTLPPPNTHAELIHLSCSHRGIIPENNSSVFHVLYDAVFDPFTQDDFIIVEMDFDESRYQIFRSGILHFKRPDPNEPGTITFQPLTRDELPRGPYICPSSNGTRRWFHAVAMNTIAASERDELGDCGLRQPVRQYRCVLRLPVPGSLLVSDPYSGRLCLGHAGRNCNVIEIWDV